MKKPTKKQYREAELEIAFFFAPRIYACGKCGWPVADGYICGTCRDQNPYHNQKGQDIRNWDD